MTCPHGMPKPSNCVTCMMDGPPVITIKWKRIGPLFESKYDGTCGYCKLPWEAGEYIQRWDYGDEKTSYTHALECGAPS